MKVKIIECSKCGDKIYSRARHDMITCTCENVMVDGGHFDGIRWNFERILGAIDSKQEYIFLDVTEAQLMDDWNMRWNKLGRIVPKIRPAVIEDIKEPKIILKNLEEIDESVIEKSKVKKEKFNDLKPLESKNGKDA